MRKLFFALIMGFSLASPAFADMSCFEEPKNDNYLDGKHGFDKKAHRENLAKKFANPQQELMMCAVAMATGAARNPTEDPTNNCGCKKAVKENCSFKINKYGVPEYFVKPGAQLGWCQLFPINMWDRP